MPSIFPMNTGIALSLLLKHLKSQCKFGRESRQGGYETHNLFFKASQSIKIQLQDNVVSLWASEEEWQTEKRKKKFFERFLFAGGETEMHMNSSHVLKLNNGLYINTLGKFKCYSNCTKPENGK